jgi:Na+/H+ antiporter NhaD/arsenite permease-like protein
VLDPLALRFLALLIFVAAYLGLSLGRLPPFRVDRTGVAIIGATAMLVTGVLPWGEAVASVDAPTLVLLFGMMIVAAYLRLSGVERTGLADEVLRSPAATYLDWPLVLTGVTAALSNLVSNVPAVLLFKPLVPKLAEPERAWLIVAMASTLAGNLTLLGSVANLIVAESARAADVRIGFLEYCRVGIPLTLVTLLAGWLILSVMPV